MSTGRASPRITGERLACVAIVAAACLPYLRTVPDYFVQDDFGVVQLLAQKPWDTFPQWFVMPWMENIWGYTPDELRPFPALSYQVTALWAISAPEAHHLFNIALHAMSAWLVYGIARAAAHLPRRSATIAAVAFALLPVAAESVAWITGRVDTMPTLFYLASFLAYVRWRLKMPNARRQYAWSLVWFFFALFSKQNTITMVATLGAYDLVLARRRIRPTWGWLRPYIPFVLLTLMFLGVRYWVFGEALRESHLSAQRLAEFGGILGRHMQRIVFGDVGEVWTIVWIFGAVCGLATVVAVWRADVATRKLAIRSALFFGPIWLAIGLAPAVAAGYESPRHAYLAAAGWAVLVGIAFDCVARLNRIRTADAERLWSRAAAVATGALLLTYGLRLHAAVGDWSLRAAVSERATTELERQVLAAPAGTLVIVGTPASSWQWAAPFVARPPFAGSDLTARAHIITPRVLHCCQRLYWDSATRRALEEWRQRPDARVIALYAQADGEVRCLTGEEDSELATLVRFLPEIESSDTLDGVITDLLQKLVTQRGRIVAPPIGG